MTAFAKDMSSHDSPTIMPDFEIREAISKDRAGIVRLISTVLQEFDLPVNLEFIEADIDIATRQANSNRARFWIAVYQNAVVASIAIVPESEEECQLKRFYILPEYRGSGLGRRLYKEAEQFARAAGYKAIVLMASRRFTKAIAFYLRNGFELIGEIDNAWEDNIYRKMFEVSTDN